MTLDLSGTERGDGYDFAQQLGRRMEAWLDELALAGALSADERRAVRLTIEAPRPFYCLDCNLILRVAESDDAGVRAHLAADRERG